MKFLFINPPVDYDAVLRPFAIEAELPPLGLLYLASSLEKEGHKVDLIDFCAENYSEEKILHRLNSVDAVGITVKSQDVKIVRRMTKLLKSHDRDLPVIIGGPHCTLDPEYSLKDIPADISVKGEGEITIVEIAKSLEGKKDLSDIHGVFYRIGDDIKRGKEYKEIEDLDSLPFPARHLVENYSYGEVIRGYNPTKGKVTAIMAGRGCPYKCKYCINRSLFKTYRVRSAENVIEEIKTIEGKYNFLHIADDNFFANKKVALKILDFLEKEKPGFDMWISGVRVDSVSDELFKKMHRAGVSSVAMGIESGNQDVLDFYNKRTTVEQAEKAVKLARKWMFFTIGYFILGAPIETEEHFRRTINFAKRLPLDGASFSPLTYLKGSLLWEEAVRAGKIGPHEYAVIADSRRGLGNFTSTELWKWVVRAFKEFYLRPKYILDQLILSFIRWDFKLLKGGFNLFVRNKENVLKMDVEDILAEIE